MNGLFRVYFRIKKGSMGIFCYSECCLLLMRQGTKNLSLSEFNNTILLAGHRIMGFPGPTWKIVLIDTFEKKTVD